ncbi:MAG: LysR family transcriptional regulator [Alphaproteobacteria bacterium]|nr:LysR family transcriptional regulator [Alphaproteobacteria bacterium]
MAQDLARLRAFVQVFEAGGFSAAAREHGRSKALLSKYVTDLEDELGVRLMNRTTRTLSLTEAGEAYYREIGQILMQLDDLDAAITHQTAEPRGLLRVSAPRNLGESTLSQALFAFLADNPDVSIDLRLEDRFVDLVDEGIDVALRISSLPDSTLIARRIADIHVSVCAAPALIARLGAPDHPAALRGLPAIIDTNLSNHSNWRFVDAGKPLTVPVSGRVKVNSPAAGAAAAAAGLGFAVVPDYVAEPFIAAGSLARVLVGHMPPPPGLHAVYAHRRHLAGKVRALIDHLVLWFDARPLR